MLGRLKDRLFDVRKGEWTLVLGLALFFFLVVATFWIVKPMRRGLMLAQYAAEPLAVAGRQWGGAEVEQLARGAGVAGVYGLVMGYGALVRRVGRQRTVYVLCGGVAALLALFAAALRVPEGWSVWLFYVFGDLVGALMVAAFWAFASDLLQPGQAQRLYGLVGLGGVLGGFVGATLVRTLVGAAGRAPLLALGIVMMGGAAATVFALGRRYTSRHSEADASGRDVSGNGLREDDRASSQPRCCAAGGAARGRAALGGARLVFGSRYLLLILGLVAFAEVVSSLVDYQLSRTVVEAGTSGLGYDAFFGLVGQITGVGSVLLQLLATGFVMKRFGIGAALLALPALLLFGSVGFLAFPSMVLAVGLSASDDALGYSINQSAREALYVATPPQENHLARAFIDLLGKRVARLAAAGLTVGFAATASAQHVRWLSLVSVAALIAWIALARRAGRAFRRRTYAARHAGGAECPDPVLVQVPQRRPRSVPHGRGPRLVRKSARLGSRRRPPAPLRWKTFAGCCGSRALKPFWPAACSAGRRQGVTGAGRLRLWRCPLNKPSADPAPSR